MLENGRRADLDIVLAAEIGGDGGERQPLLLGERIGARLERRLDRPGHARRTYADALGVAVFRVRGVAVAVAGRDIGLDRVVAPDQLGVATDDDVVMLLVGR